RCRHAESQTGVNGWVATGFVKKACLTRLARCRSSGQGGVGSPRPYRTRLAQTSAKRGPTPRQRRGPSRAGVPGARVCGPVEGNGVGRGLVMLRSRSASVWRPAGLRRIRELLRTVALSTARRGDPLGELFDLDEDIDVGTRWRRKIVCLVEQQQLG